MSSENRDFVVSYPVECQPFMDAILSIVQMHTKKSHDYGSGENPYHNIEACEDLGIPAWVGVTLRMNDKEVRIKNFLQKGELANESVRDSIHDNAVYGILRLMEYDRIQPKAETDEEFLVRKSIPACKDHDFDRRRFCVVCGWSEPVKASTPDNPVYWGHNFTVPNKDVCADCGMPGTEWEGRVSRRDMISCHDRKTIMEALTGVGLPLYPELHHFTNGTSGECADCGLTWETYARAYREGRCTKGACYTHGMGEAHTPLRHNSMGDAPSD